MMIQEKTPKRGIIKKMTREFKKWWLLRNLRNDCDGHVEVQDINALKNGLYVSVDKAAYLDTLSKLPRNQKLSERKLRRKLTEYDSIILECIGQQLIVIGKSDNPADTRNFIRVSYKGDDYLSKFWYRIFIGNFIATALIITLIGWIFINFVLKPAITEIKLKTPPASITTPINVYPNIYLNATTTTLLSRDNAPNIIK